MHYTELPPAEPLLPYVWTYWAFTVPPEAPPQMHRVMPDGCVTVVYFRPAGGPSRVVLSGPRLAPLDVPVAAGDGFWGARLRPGAAHAILGLGVPPLRDARLPLSAVCPTLAPALMSVLDGAATAAEAVAAFDRLLAPLAAAAPPVDPTVAAAVDALVASAGQTPVSALAAEVGLSPRQLLRRFRRATELTPKEFARIRRFRASAGNVLREAPHPWGRVAADHGFADQSHLTREYAALYGASPGALAERVRSIAHVDVEP